MIKRKDIIRMLKTMNTEKLESNGPTSIFFGSRDGKSSKTFTLSVQSEFIIVTTGKLLFKRKYRIHKNELQFSDHESSV